MITILFACACAWVHTHTHMLWHICESNFNPHRHDLQLKSSNYTTINSQNGIVHTVTKPQATLLRNHGSIPSRG